MFCTRRFEFFSTLLKVLVNGELVREYKWINCIGGKAYKLTKAGIERAKSLPPSEVSEATETADQIDKGGQTPPKNNDTSPRPPKGYVGVKEIQIDDRFRKFGKNPSRQTISDWCSRHPPEGGIYKDPGTQEVHLPEKWTKERIRLWTPRRPSSAINP